MHPYYGLVSPLMAKNIAHLQDTICNTFVLLTMFCRCPVIWGTKHRLLLRVSTGFLISFGLKVLSFTPQTCENIREVKRWAFPPCRWSYLKSRLRCLDLSLLLLPSLFWPSFSLSPPLFLNCVPCLWQMGVICLCELPITRCAWDTYHSKWGCFVLTCNTSSILLLLLPFFSSIFSFHCSGISVPADSHHGSS